ncbi:MAG: arsenic resistance protein, partial [Ktedonobacteraceae bacterium]
MRILGSLYFNLRSNSSSSLPRICLILFNSLVIWGFISDGDPAYTLVQVSVNDLLMLVLFAPIVRFLVSGASSLQVPFEVLVYSVLVFIVIPLIAGVVLRRWWIRAKGRAWFEDALLPRFAPLSMGALLATLVLIFAFQA